MRSRQTGDGATVGCETDYVEIEIPADFDLLQVDALTALIADAFDSSTSGATEVKGRAGNNRVRQDFLGRVRSLMLSASKVGGIRLRDVNGVVIESSLSDSFNGQQYVEYDEFAKFALDALRVRVVRSAHTFLLGRYSLHEAARAISHDEAASLEIVERLKDAARSGELPVFATGSSTPMRLDKTFVRSYGSARWQDLNDWLAANEPGVDFRFPTPSNAYVASLAGHRAPRPLSQEAARDDWKEVARRLADEAVPEIRRSGKNPSLRNVAKFIAPRLAKLDGGKYRGNRGERSEHGIRSALTGWKAPPPGEVD